MKYSRIIVLFLSFITQAHAINLLPFNKVIIWGHKLHSHTHSYIHYAFDKAFKHLGYKTYWFDARDKKKLKNFDFKNSLFITEGQVDQGIPLRTDCTYILHNCDGKKYKKIFDAGNAIILQVYTHDALTNHTDVQKIDECMYYSMKDRVIYLPWATDLLPDEIEERKKQAKINLSGNTVFFIGTINGGEYGNEPEVTQFNTACAARKIQFRKINNVSEQENITLTQRSYIAPAIQGSWQCRQGYIPCRIFKNISYGQWGVTNSETVSRLFHGKITYNPNCYQLFFDAENKIKQLTIEELYDLMDFVKEKHTYINRIDELFKFITRVKEIYKK